MGAELESELGREFEGFGNGYFMWCLDSLRLKKKTEILDISSKTNDISGLFPTEVKP